MKTSRFVTAFVFPLATAFTVLAQQPPAPAVPAAPKLKPEMGAMILLANGQRQRGFLQDTSQQGLVFSLVERAPGQPMAWTTGVTAVAFDESDEVMREARAAFTQGRLDSAVDAMGAIAERYENMAWVPNGFAAEARYYQIEALRLLGRWQEMAPLLLTPTGQAIPTRLPAYYQPQFKLNLLWSQYGAGQGEGIKAAVAAAEIPVVGQAKLLPTASFRAMPLRELAQITFFRAKINDGAGKLDQALADYYRTFSLSFGNEKLLGDLAMKSAMAIHAKNLAVAAGKEVPLRQIQSLAYFYKTAIGQGQIDPAMAAFAVKPALPRPVQEVEEPKPAEAAPAAPGAPAMPAKAGEPVKGAPATPATPAAPATPAKGAPATPATPAAPATPAKAGEPAKGAPAPATPAKGAPTPKAPAPK